jgi:hypothetical protein
MPACQGVRLQARMQSNVTQSGKSTVPNTCSTALCSQTKQAAPPSP